MAKADLTAARLRELLDYNPETGVFAWKVRKSIRRSVGATAGTVQVSNAGSYKRVSIAIDYARYKAHRLAWLYVYGEWPAGVIDHINGDSMDNRIANLRDTNQFANLQNLKRVRSDSRTGVQGVGYDARRRKYTASIRAFNKRYRLGSFETAEAAQEAYIAAKRRLHPSIAI
jgi:hypothetical protein